MKKDLIFVKKYSNSSALGTTAPTKHYYVDVTDADRDKFGPFNSISVYNFGDHAVELRFEGDGSDRVEIIPKDSVYEFFPEDKTFHFMQPIITNPSATYSIGASEITVVVRAIGTYGQHMRFR